MTVNTRRLFTALLRRLQIDVVCDVGSMDGADALGFRRTLPTAHIYAFEPNPENVRQMQANPQLREHHIEVVPAAVSEADGQANFYLVGADYTRHNESRGMSSLYERPARYGATTVLPVTTTRLDTYLRGRCSASQRLALWIDVEGKAYEVIESLGALAAQVQLLHVETEAEALIGRQQKLSHEVKGLLLQLGFVEVATDRRQARLQFNSVFVRADLSAVLRLQVSGYLLLARPRYLAVTALERYCPSCVRVLQAARRRMRASLESLTRD